MTLHNSPLANAAEADQILSTAATDSVLFVTRIATSRHDAIRLKRMGICEGRQIQLVQAGDPLIVRVIGCRLGISRMVADKVWVKPCSEFSVSLVAQPG